MSGAPPPEGGGGSIGAARFWTRRGRGWVACVCALAALDVARCVGVVLGRDAWEMVVWRPAPYLRLALLVAYSSDIRSQLRLVLKILPAFLRISALVLGPARPLRTRGGRVDAAGRSRRRRGPVAAMPQGGRDDAANGVSIAARRHDPPPEKTDGESRVPGPGGDEAASAVRPNAWTPSCIRWPIESFSSLGPVRLRPKASE